MSTPLQIAESYVGFRSRALRTNDFGAKTGHNTEIWSGSFLQVVFQEAWPGQFLPALAHTASALHFAELYNLTVTEPRPGDVVFYTFPTDLLGMAQQHVGIVSDVQNWKSQGQIQAIEGETSPNSARKHAGTPDGVWKRTRYATEITHFVRFERLKQRKMRRNPPNVTASAIQYLKNGSAVPHIQLALSDVFGNDIRGVRKGVWDAGTAHAYGAWQRFYGEEPTGLPSRDSLHALGHLTGRFETE